MGFNVQEMLDPLDYDFRPYVEAQGVTPEPSDETMKAVQAALGELFPVKVDEDGKAVLDIEALSDRVKTVEEGSALEQQLFDTIEKLTGGKPTGDEIRGLPYRAQRAYMGWLFGKLLNPEA